MINSEIEPIIGKCSILASSYECGQLSLYLMLCSPTRQLSWSCQLIMELQLWGKHFPMPIQGKMFPFEVSTQTSLHMELKSMSWVVSSALAVMPSYALWELVPLFADDKTTLRTCMHVHRKARVGFLMLREDIFQKTNPDQVCTHYFVSMRPLLRA